MRILTALTYYRPHYSGLTIYAERQARALAERGHHVMILTSRFDRSLLQHEICDGVEVFRPRVLFHISKGVIMPSMPIWAWKLVRQADVVQLHVPQLDAAPIALLSRLLGKPVVLTYHCDLQLPSGFVHAVANRVSDLANHTTALASNLIVHNTRDYAEHSPFLRRYLHKLHPIAPPVEAAPVTEADLQTFRRKYNIQPGQRLIGIAARLATEKGVEYLAQALPIVLERYPQARLLMVGPYQNVVGESAYAARLAPVIEGLGEHWTFLGTVPPVELSAFFHESEVTVLPSINSTESYGIVQVESLIFNTPVVATSLPGVRVPVTRTGAGIIVPPADPVALAQALITVLENPAAYRGQPELLTSISTPEAVAVAYEDLFNALLQRGRNPEYKLAQKSEADAKECR
ncbi:MAG: glycosyltransferase family 4 protein [Chloroflexota bacterium]